MTGKELEKYSSAITLSDMEMFIFPELLYSLVLANAMSGIVWDWKNDPWFSQIHEMNEHRKVQRVKQFIMDRFIFNLDLETWGLTDKEKELERFHDFIDEKILSQSNALFGYEGDKYYFDIDIRRHFGLDKYTDNIIPYWKTETIEAMEAFRFRAGYTTGAGECVSLSTLYAAALFVIADIPLEKIHLLATPLHSQNFIDLRDGIITNNRRIITKTMWFNGTEQSIKARRAIENEKITMIVNNFGYVHIMYENATMPKEIFEEMSEKLKKYLITTLNYEVFISFLRENIHCQKYFQFSKSSKIDVSYIKSERVFFQENLSKSRAGTDSHKALVAEIPDEYFVESPLKNRFILDDFEKELSSVNKKRLSPKSLELRIYLHNKLADFIPDIDDFIEKIIKFSYVKPKLPDIYEKKIVEVEPIILSAKNGRDDLISQIYSLAEKSEVAKLAITAFRDLRAENAWKPFLKAAYERNPVCFEALKDKNYNEIYEILQNLPDKSIYFEDFRLAQPDEVWNFQRGDGLEKAITLASIISQKTKMPPKLSNKNGVVLVDDVFLFRTNKKLFDIINS